MKKRSGRSVLVVAAHKDDEVLGCGGTIARHKAEGDSVGVVILAEGITSRDTDRTGSEKVKTLVARLNAAARRANSILGVRELEIHSLPDNRMDGVDLLDVVKIVESAVKKFSPEIVYTHFAGDLNVDHMITHKAVVTACRPINDQAVRRILSFEVPSSTEWQSVVQHPQFAPNYFVDVSKYLKTKLDALKAYKSEMRAWPHPRSMQGVIHLAKWRGAVISADAAEAFMLVREIV